MSNQPTNKILILKITRAIRYSGFLAVHSPQDFQTLIALYTFANREGKVRVSCKSLAFALNLSEKQASLRLKRICRIKWQGRPLVIKISSNKAKFAPNRYCLKLPDELMFIQEESQSQKTSKESKWTPLKKAIEQRKWKTKGTPVPEAEVRHNNVVENNKTTDNNQLISLLKAKGITEAIAKGLVEKYPAERILAQLKMLPYRRANNPAGMLIKSIQENWGPPQAHRSNTQASQGPNIWEAIKNMQKAKEARRAQELARRRVHQQKIEAIKAKMSTQELTKIRERAKQKIAGALKHAYGDNLPEVLVNAEMNYIISSEYLKHEQSTFQKS
jgi:hypothetical protein